MESEKYLEGQSMQRPPLFESDGFIYWKNRFETYVKSKDLDLWHVITDDAFPPIQNNPETKKNEVGKKAEEKRNRPPTRAQQRSIMCTYLKNMAGWKPKDLKSKTELVEGTEMEESSKKAEESSSKRVGDELD
ncbi:hypothetical protein Tco_0726272 [Tanacetum coccineum]|uniref:DUF4219 domain-containing protein n=1 Tax=Tanacetum coccineum TaxID=301880 RepID=A0ABQ4YG69_9ASTR